jgi:hypothetical protein
MLYEVRDCCNDLVAMISSLKELEEVKQNHPCYKRVEGSPCSCGAYDSSLELRVYQVDDNNGDPDEAYEKAVEYYLDMESLSFQWEQACRDDSELLDK